MERQKTVGLLLGGLLIVLITSCSESESEKAELAATVTMPEGIKWREPKSWQRETSSSSFRKAQYRLPQSNSDTEDATCIVYYFGGEGGGVQANLERWYGQFKQPDGSKSSDAATITTATVNDLAQTRVALSGTYLFTPMPMSRDVTEKPNFRMLAAVVETSTGPWFVKLVGPEATVKNSESAFKSFMDSFAEN